MGINVKYTQIFINNEWHDSVNGKTFATINPSNGETIAHIQEGDNADIDKAVTAARNAFEFGSKWREMDASARGTLLYKLADLIERDRSTLIELEIADVGKLKCDAELDLDGVISLLRYYGGWADKVHGKTIPADGKIFSYTRHEPFGVCGLIIPWNYPLLMMAWKFGPALATGNTVVLKPAEQSPLTALYCASLAVEAGFPPGVINVVPGYGSTAGAALASHLGVDKISFTGSTQIGELILKAAAKNTKRATILASGKSPIVVTDDFDLERAVQIAHNACFGNAGQVCCAATRTYVHQNIYDLFVKKSTKLANSRVVGDPTLPDTTQGPQIDAKQTQKILDLIESGIKEGAKLECGGSRIECNGYFIKPTVFSNVTDNMTIAREEIFGPVQQILKYKSLDEVIERCNDSQYGLAAGLLTHNINSALQFTARVRAGSVWVNCFDLSTAQTPFGGFKRSGQGRELGEDSLREYTEIKTVTIAVTL